MCERSLLCDPFFVKTIPRCDFCGTAFFYTWRIDGFLGDHTYGIGVLDVSDPLEPITVTTSLIRPTMGTLFSQGSLLYWAGLSESGETGLLQAYTIGDDGVPSPTGLEATMPSATTVGLQEGKLYFIQQERGFGAMDLPLIGLPQRAYLSFIYSSRVKS